MKSLFSILALLVFTFTATFAQWEEPKNSWGIRVIQKIVKSGDNLIALGDYVYLSSDNGESWVCNDEVRGYIMEKRGNDVFTLDGVNRFFHSTDNGVSWSKFIAHGLYKAPYKTSLVVGNNNKLFLGSTGNGVYLSSDDCRNWVEKDNGLTGKIYSLALAGNNLFAATPSGIFLSTDDGDNWIEKNNGIVTSHPQYITSDGNNVFVCAGREQGIYLSTNNGDSWTAKNNGLNLEDVHFLAISGNNLFASSTFAGEGVYRSTDYGESWTKKSNGLENVAVYTITIIGNNIYAGTVGGVYLSTDNGDSWIEKNNGILHKKIFEIEKNSYSHVYASTQNAYWETQDSGKTWFYCNIFPFTVNEDIYTIALNKDQTRLSGTSHGNIYIYWKVKYKSPDSLPISKISINENYIFAGIRGGGIILSTDDGETWTEKNTGLTNKDINTLISVGGNVFAGTQGGGVFLSTNNGENWVEKNTGLNNKNVTSFARMGNDIFAGTNGGGIFISTDNGNSWVEKNNGLTNLFVTSIAVIENNVFVGTDGGGIFLSYDNGENWLERNVGLKNHSVLSIAITITNYIYVGTESGLFMATLGDFGITSVEDTFLAPNFAFSIHPNPASEYITIQTSEVLETSEVSDIKIFNILGESVIELADVQHLGDVGHLQRIDISHLPRGVYYLRIGCRTQVFVKV